MLNATPLEGSGNANATACSAEHLHPARDSPEISRALPSSKPPPRSSSRSVARRECRPVVVRVAISAGPGPVAPAALVDADTLRRHGGPLVRRRGAAAAVDHAAGGAEAREPVHVVDVMSARPRPSRQRGGSRGIAHGERQNAQHTP
jgi:hypothetical protein